MSDESQEIDRRRIASLENVVRALVAQVEALRADVARLQGRGEVARGLSWEPAVEHGAPSTGPASSPAGAGEAPASGAARAERPAHPAPARAPAAASAPALDLERLIGRYGTLAVAALAILLGVGAFLQWAIARGLLGPEVRVLLGAIAAAVLAAIGLRLRDRGSERFGNVLLALSLAVLHLVAWAAGPSLGIVNPFVALAVAAAASIALAGLALRDGEEFLFSVGLGGALVAPYVTSIGAGSGTQLLIYGWVVMTGAIFVIREPSWQVARWLVTAFAATYLFSGLDALRPPLSVAAQYRPATLGLALAASAIVIAHADVRRLFARSMLALLVLVVFTLGGRSTEQLTVVYAALGTLATVAMVRRDQRALSDAASTATAGGAVAGAAVPARRERDDAGFDTLLLPLGFLLSAIVTGGRWDEPEGAMIAAGWAALGATLAAMSGGRSRGQHAAMALVAMQFVIFAALDDRTTWSALATSALAAISAFSVSRLPGRAPYLPTFFSLVLATAYAYDQLDSRQAFTYRPFLETPSLIALSAVLAWEAFARFALPTKLTSELAWLRALGLIAAFLWVRAELAEAFSADLAVFLLISYYAVAGVAAIGVGRAREMPTLRHVGLAQALLAALKGFVEAQDLRQVGLRVGSYLITGVFLLGVGFWYRRKAE